MPLIALPLGNIKVAFPNAALLYGKNLTVFPLGSVWTVAPPGKILGFHRAEALRGDLQRGQDRETDSHDAAVIASHPLPAFLTSPSLLVVPAGMRTHRSTSVAASKTALRIATR